MGLTLDLDAVRRRAVETTVAQELGSLWGKDSSFTSPAGTAFVGNALREGFSIGRGVLPVARLATLHGIGFLRDAQHPQLAALLSEAMRDDEPWRLALLQQWADWLATRGAAAAFASPLARLRHLAALVQDHGANIVSHDPAAVFHAIDPAKTALQDAAQWHGIARIWQGYFRQAWHGAVPLQIDYACVLAFCCGQYFQFDPLWHTLADLNPDSLFSLVS